MALSKEAKQAAKDAAKKAGQAARKKAGELAEKAKGAAGRANTKLREMKGRRIVDAGEVLAGGAIAGAVHGRDKSWKMYAEYSADGKTITNPADVVEVPYGVPGGLGLIAAGIATKSYDLQALGLGSLTFGVGRMVEDASRGMNQDKPAA